MPESLSEHELREKIASLRHDCFHTCPYWQKTCFQHDWIVHNEGLCQWIQDQIITLVKQAGCVKLAEDQSLPHSNPDRGADYGGYWDSQRDMLKQNWRKVEL